MPAALSDEIDYGYADGNTSRGYFLSCRNELRNAGVDIQANNWAAANAHLYNAGTHLGDAATYLLTQVTYASSLARHWKNALYWINDNWPTSTTITMDDILTAMTTASFPQLQNFIGLVEAYKSALWDAPFNEDYYAALARGFRQWP